MYESGVMDPNVTMRVENGRIVLGLLGYCVEIGIIENITALSDMLLESMFSWMNAIWEVMNTSFDYRSLPDLRDRIDKNVGTITQELEEQKRRIESADWQFRIS